jgi:hypothetical protein
MEKDGKRRFAAIVLTHNFRLLDENDDPVRPQGTLRRADVEWMGTAPRGACAGGVLSQYTRDLGPATTSTTTIALPPPLSESEQDENGVLVLAEVRGAVNRRELGHLRMLCAWFPYPTLHMPEVHELLDGLESERAEQIAGRRPGNGCPPRYGEQLDVVTTLNRLVDEEDLDGKGAARRLAPKPGAGVHRLENLRSTLGRLARCLRGYRIPPEDAPCGRWGQKPDEELAVYVLPNRAE